MRNRHWALGIALPAVACAAQRAEAKEGALGIASSAVACAGQRAEAKEGALGIASPAVACAGQRAEAKEGALGIALPAVACAAQRAEAKEGALGIALPAVACAAQRAEAKEGALGIASPAVACAAQRAEAKEGALGIRHFIAGRSLRWTVGRGQGAALGIRSWVPRSFSFICHFRFAMFMLVLLASFSSRAQLVDDMEDESKLYAESKQVNQFFRRFNGEEDEKGKRYYPGDKNYRNTRLRKNYLGTLFDESNRGISNELKVEFAKDVLDKSTPAILSFHGGNWFSEVHTTFTMNGKTQPVILFMKLEKHHLGTRWVIYKVYADMFDSYFARDTARVGKFLHPLSHELDFMNLRKAFVNKDSINQFTLKRFVPDHLSLFLYEIQKGNLKFKTVNEVKFHFFQIEGWYFELSEFNRPGYNTGWLISNLARVNNATEKDLLRRYIYNEKL